MKLAYLDESQNEAFDFEYHSEVELKAKVAFIRDTFPNGPRRILDIGGGNGKFLDGLLAEFPESEGYLVDISRNLLDKNRPNPKKHLIHGSFEDLPRLLPGTTFDLITINWVLHHLVGPSYILSVKNVEQALAMTSRMLGPRGLLFVAENEYQGLLETNVPSHVIYTITRIRNPAVVGLTRRYFNTAGVGVCFQSKRGWFKIFERCGLRVDYYKQHSPWRHGLKKHLLFLALFLRTQRHGHFALRPRTP
ncbi:MAG TPA: class I SAM-dependent methyltransferase [Steroidobacteraceae bacterium]|jgi:ubiquinone/menaquinone biosynthesis C-methylase UbiE